MIGTPLSRLNLDNAIQADAAWLLRTLAVARQRHEQYLHGMPANLADLQAVDESYTDADLSAITALSYHFDRLQQLLQGTVPGSAGDALADATLILNPTVGYPIAPFPQNPS